VDIVNPQVETYMRSLLERYDETVLLEMEAEGRERGFPIIGRLVGVTVELLARSIGARRVFELGSGFGYSAYWFSRAVGSGGEVHCTDGDPANEAKALGYLERAALADRVRWHVGDAVSNLAEVDGEFDVVYDDIDKVGYPDAWRAAAERIRVGGLYICDTSCGTAASRRPSPPVRHRAILERNALIAETSATAPSSPPRRPVALRSHDRGHRGVRGPDGAGTQARKGTPLDGVE
jgi:predicted O-methyltransferase YrrM